MIFASDLDRTLLFSKKNFSTNNKDVVFLDVKPSGEEVSFITRRALNDLIKVSDKINFIPVTAREKHQLENVKFEENNVRVNYAIVGNGSTILKNGEVHKDWEEVTDSIKNNIDLEKLRFIILNKYSDVKNRERSFGFEIFKKNISNELLEIVNSIDGLRVEEDHRRSYIMFNGISKLNALHFLKKELKYNYSIASGDSIMDLPMLLDSDVGIVCSTGDLVTRYKTNKNNNLIFTESCDSNSAEEVLQVVKGYLNI